MTVQRAPPTRRSRAGRFLATLSADQELELCLLRIRLAVLAALISLAVVVILLVVLYVRDRGNRASSEEVQISLNAQKFDTTLGDFHDMREALRPLEHVRAASRRDPNSSAPPGGTSATLGQLTRSVPGSETSG